MFEGGNNEVQWFLAQFAVIECYWTFRSEIAYLNVHQFGSPISSILYSYYG